ncbi:MAG: hypothetical protein NNA18_11605 [Nitrospira sp.]|nr:hypothetical protein [Nitrospira sp.]
MVSPLLYLANLTFSGEGRTILDRLNLVILPREIYGLLGADGSGTIRELTDGDSNESLYGDD